MAENYKKLYRSVDRKIGGVCGGVAEYLNVDPTVIRIIYLLLVLCGFVGVVVYLIMWLLMPEHNGIQNR
ncbi:MAG: PspC domain-containing protein [Bacteroidales bacterium]|nr:PspC domain-containing protein [Candidatus Colimorpha merdihippi]MCQ2282451.1 PspC domain-containing protein [Bacteroidales bacterium]